MRIRDLEAQLRDAYAEIEHLNKMASPELWISVCDCDLDLCRHDECEHPAHYFTHGNITEVYISASKFKATHGKHRPERNGKFYRLCGRVQPGSIFTRLNNDRREVRIWTCEWC